MILRSPVAISVTNWATVLLGLVTVQTFFTHTHSEKWNIYSNILHGNYFPCILLRVIAVHGSWLSCWFPYTCWKVASLPSLELTWGDPICALPRGCHWGATVRRTCCRRRRRAEDRDTRFWATTKFPSTSSSSSWLRPWNSHFRLGLKVLRSKVSARCKEREMDVCVQEPGGADRCEGAQHTGETWRYNSQTTAGINWGCTGTDTGSNIGAILTQMAGLAISNNGAGLLN